MKAVLPLKMTRIQIPNKTDKNVSVTFEMPQSLKQRIVHDGRRHERKFSAHARYILATHFSHGK